MLHRSPFILLLILIQVLGFTAPQTWALRISVASIGLMVIISAIMILRLNDVSKEARDASQAAADLSTRTEALESRFKQT